jgi:hypothetical protein
MRCNPYEELAAAIEAERAAWNLAKDHLPGTPGHDPQRWEAWRAAMHRCEEARKQLGAPPPEAPQDRPGWS